ncbi:MAG: hypothetical protein HC927_06780 [Deltaproteobacteria bacterium]|nr:hypothetical protein [Deltaproteobacteria bacterium]
MQPLPLDRAPFTAGEDPESDVDLIFIGSFVSSRPEYAAYMAQFGDSLDDYIDRAGLLVQMAQADQTEPAPPFLPDTQDAVRVDTDFEEAIILSPEHPLLQGIPTSGASGDRIDYTFDSGAFWSDLVGWEVFNLFFGFEVILSGDDDARFPILMEGAYGQGRFLLAAMAFDKIFDQFGVDRTTESLGAFNTAFFANLYDYTKAVSDRATPPITITPQPGDSALEDGAWTIVLLPDTQIYSQNFPGMY